MPTLLKGCLEDICVLMFKVKHNLCPAYISHIFSEHNFNYNLRQFDLWLTLQGKTQLCPAYISHILSEHSSNYNLRQCDLW